MTGSMNTHLRPAFLITYRAPLVLSALAHAVLLGLLSTSLIVIPRQPMPQLAIEAVVVDEGMLRRMAEAEQQQVEAVARQAREEQQRRAAEQRRIEEAVAQRQREAQQQREAAAREQAAAETQRRAEADRQRQESERQRQEAEQQRQQAEAERQRQAEAAAAEQRKREAEAQARREQEQREAAERARAEVARQGQARREAELAAAMAAEEALFSARQSGELDRYVALIQQRVQRNWVRPPSAVSGLVCEVVVVQLPNGDVIDVRTEKCNGDDVARRSVENAVRRSSPLPLPDNRALFERNLRFTFRPQE